MWVSTFHSACVRILRRDATRLGYPSSFTIYDQADAVRLTGLRAARPQHRPKRFPPRSVHAAISAAKNDGVDLDSYRESAENIYERKIADVYTEYQPRLHRAGAMDFDDLLAVTVQLLQTQPDVLEHYQRPLPPRARRRVPGHQRRAERPRHAARRRAPQRLRGRRLGPVPAPRHARRNAERSSANRGDPRRGPGPRYRWRCVSDGRRRHRGQGRALHRTMPVVLAGGEVLRGTPHHIVPARMGVRDGAHFVYLMYRADRGYRIGRTKRIRSDSRGRPDFGFRVRIGQEHADKLWILRVCDSLADAAYWESWFAASYGLPTACFHALGRELALDDEWLAKLYSSLDTETRAKELMEDLDLHHEFPHARPQNGLRRQTLNLTMFSDRRQGNPGHRVQWSSNRADVAERIVAAGFDVRGLGGSRTGFRFETARTDYREALDLAHRVADAGGLEVRRRMVVDSTVYDFTPLSHLRAGMLVLVERDGQFAEVAVESVEYVDYDGPVYDLEVDRNHTYVADGLLVHNSIYRFRGADMRNILEFEKAFPDATVVVLEQNYRSTQTILDAANAVIANNVGRKPKELWTESGAGDKPSSASTPTTRSTRRSGSPTRCHAARRRRRALGRHRRLLPDQRPEPRARGAVPAGRHPVQGRRRHPLLRPARDQGRDRLPEGRREPGRRGEPSSASSTCPSAASATRRSAGSTRARRAKGITFIDALRRWDEAGVAGRGRSRGIESFLGSSTTSAPRSTTGPGRAARVGPRPLRLRRRARRPSTRSRPRARLENLAELVGIGPGVRDRSTSSSSRSPSSPTPTSCPTDDPSEPVRHDDPALGQGPRVPGRVPHRAWRTACSRTCVRSASPPSSRRSGGSPTSASPGPASASTCRTRGVARSTGPRSTTRPAGSSTRSRRS